MNTTLAQEIADIGARAIAERWEMERYQEEVLAAVGRSGAEAVWQTDAAGRDALAIVSSNARVVLIFAEDDFAELHAAESLSDARAFCEGVDAGAALYGGGKWRTYVMPEDETEMLAAEHVGEIMKAHEAMQAAAKS